MGILKETIEEMKENCGGMTGGGMGAGGMMKPTNLLTFLVKRGQAEDEESGAFRMPGEHQDGGEGSSNNFSGNIDEQTTENTNFRKVLFTSEKSQLVLMSLKPGENIGMETHDGDQFFRFEAGEGKVIMDGQETPVSDGSAVVVSEGTEHDVVNTSDSEDLKLYAIYSPPQHEDGTVDENKPEGSDEPDGDAEDMQGGEEDMQGDENQDY